MEIYTDTKVAEINGGLGDGYGWTDGRGDGSGNEKYVVGPSSIPNSFHIYSDGTGYPSTNSCKGMFIQCYTEHLHITADNNRQVGD
jgi:hypothetical protein